MIKLILCFVAAIAVAVCMLQLRQQKLELGHQANALHSAIDAKHSKLWNQQLQIAIYTAPNAIQKTVGTHKLDLTPLTPTGVGPTSWIDGQTAEQPAH